MEATGDVAVEDKTGETIVSARYFAEGNKQRRGSRAIPLSALHDRHEQMAC